jgi:hypothetical protein
MNESLDRLESLFPAALQQPPADRAAYLDQVCADDQALRQRNRSAARRREMPLNSECLDGRRVR